MSTRLNNVVVLIALVMGIFCAAMVLTSNPAEAVQSQVVIDNLVGRAVVYGATSYDVSGTVTLQGRAANECTGTVVWIFHQGQVGADTLTSVTTNAWGEFTLSHPGLGNGTYEVRAKCDSYVALVSTVVIFDADVTNAGVGPLPAGDLTGDNRVDFYDLVIMGADFGTTNSRSDLNLDGMVNETDYVMVRDNYHRVGD